MLRTFVRGMLDESRFCSRIPASRMTEWYRCDVTSNPRCFMVSRCAKIAKPISDKVHSARKSLIRAFESRVRGLLIRKKKFQDNPNNTN